MLTQLPKPLLFGLLGGVGCLVGWLAGEPVLRTLAPVPSPGPATGPAAPGAAPSLIFSNPVMQQVMTERGAHQGAVKIGLIWPNVNDLDLHCVDPSGEEISFEHKRSRSGGQLDLDCNVGPPYRNPGAEHIFWGEGEAPAGTYRVFVQNYANKGGADPTHFEVEILARDRVLRLSGDLPANQRSTVREFTLAASPASGTLASGAGGGPGVAATRFEPLAVVLVGLWGALLAIPLGGALVLGQNALQRRALLQPRQLPRLLGGGLMAGFLSGAASQGGFALLAQRLGLTANAGFLGAGQVVGWGVLGTLLGFAMAFFIPNLPRRFAALGGLCGGLLGGVVFVVTKQAAGDFTGRAVGAASLGLGIGMMIALAEKLAREAALVVHWGPSERSVINLGPKPVILGSSAEADLYLPKEKGFPPVTALVTFTNGQIEIENKLTNSRHTLRNGSRLQLGDLAVEIRAG